MLTKRQNLLETIHGGKPDRYVNQYEAFAMLFNNPHSMHDPAPEYGKPPVKKCMGYHKKYGRKAHLAHSRFMMKNTLYVKIITKMA